MNKKIRFKNLTAEDRDFIRQVFFTRISHQEKIDILTGRYKVTGRSIRNWWVNLGLYNKDTRIPVQIEKARERTLDIDSKVILVTTAQNRTLVNMNLLQSMEVYRDYITNDLGKKCEIVVIPATYHNPTNIKDKENVVNWWGEQVEPYLFYNKINFGDTLVHTSFRVRPTARLPLSSLDLLARSGHLVIGHPRVHFKTLPRFNGDKLSTMSTTGYCTYRNYSNSKAGDIAENHHTYGFSIIEKKDDGTCFIPRNVKCNRDGSFTDLIYSVSEGEVKKVDSSMGLVWGDIHRRELDNNCYNKTIELCKLLNPKVNILHDVFDGSTVNHHERKDLYIQKKRIREGKSDIQKEVNESLDFINKLQEDTDSDVKVIYSNHDYFLDRHVNEYDWRKDLHNSDAYLKYAMIQQKEDMEKHGCLFGYEVNSMGNSRVEYITPRDKYKVGDYLVSLHGDFGFNGAKGSANTWKRFNSKVIGAHTHSPQIVDGYTCVGVTAKLDQYYTRRSLSSWAHSHAIIHDTGKCQLLVMDNDYQISGLI